MKSTTKTPPQSATILKPGGISVTIVDTGAGLAELQVPTPRGCMATILSYSDVADYAADPYYVGSTIGPVANRIANAAFNLQERRYQLEDNESERGNCLHSGSDGLHRQRFALRQNSDKTAIRCRLTLADGVGGFPGNRVFEVCYSLIDDCSLAIDFTAKTDRATLVNIANHAYFNLGGPIDDHDIRVVADAYTPVDTLMVPVGHQQDVGNSQFDLRKKQRLGDRQFDHSFVLTQNGDAPRLAAELASPTSGLQLSVLTTQPAIQVYTGDYLAAPFCSRQGLCFEAQGFPDAPNQPTFPSVALSADATYRHRTIYRFS